MSPNAIPRVLIKGRQKGPCQRRYDDAVMGERVEMLCCWPLKVEERVAKQGMQMALEAGMDKETVLS